MKWKNWLADYLTFTRKERIGLLFLICLILVIFLLPDIISNNTDSQYAQADTSWISAVRKLEIKDTESKARRSFNTQSADNDNAYQYDRPASNSPVPGTLFYFDPNTISRDGWKKLGMREKTIHTIQTYLSKGGRFRKSEDLQRIYGLFPGEYARIAPYIKMESAGETKSYKDYAGKTPVENETPKTLTSRYSTIEINLADTAAFISLPGIGSKLAARIVNFRDKLGGFYSIAQVGETYGLPDSTFQKVKQYLALVNTSVKKININSATIDDLKAHPYLKFNIANPIVSYRTEHGPFLKLEDLKKVMAVTDEIYNKIAPYLTLQ